jgi:hypothetical protein
MGEIRIVERDYKIFREIERWRVCLGRHIRELAGFGVQRTCDSRLRKLIDAGFITRKKILYGVPSIYSNTSKAKNMAGLPGRSDKIRIEQIGHDIMVLDTAIYIHKATGIPFDAMQTEKQLHMQDGFGVRKHRPDFVFFKGNEKYCVELELSLKAKSRLENNIKDNFMEYDKQIWVVPDRNTKIAQIIKQNIDKYPELIIWELERIKQNG